MKKEELLKAIMELPKTETDNLISAMNSVNINDLMSAVDRFDKVPTYDELLKENKKYKEVIDKAINELFILKDMIYKPETREENFEIQRKISSIIKRLNGKEVSE